MIAFALSSAGLLATPHALTLLLAYENEDSFVVWDELASSVAHLRY
jgi:hypothetical protein